MAARKDALTQDPLPPCNPDAEAGILGSILIDPAVLDEVAEVLTGGANDFYVSEHRTVFAAMLTLWKMGIPADLITVTDRLGDMRSLEEIGGAAFVSSLANNVPTSANAVHYARIVREKARRRHEMNMGSLLTLAAASVDDDAAYDELKRGIAESLAGDTNDGVSSLPILTDEEAEALPPLRGILGSILFDESVSYLYGPSGSWKSFVALDWALSIATGRAWMGRPVVEGDVLYVCAEGARGIGKRITAWKQRHGVTGRTRLRVMPIAVDLTNMAQLAALPRRLDALDIHPALIVFDTLAASISGDENAAEVAGSIDRAARRIIRTYENTCVLIVHHTGYDASHMRGSTAFFANADTVIRLERADPKRRIEPGDPITLVSDKAKDGEPFHDIVLTAESQSWATEDGAIHSSLVIVAGDEAAAARAAANAKDDGMTPKRRVALDILEAAGDKGLSWTEWFTHSGMSRGAFFAAVKYFTQKELVGPTPSGDYIRLAASSVSSVQFSSGSAEPAYRSSVQFGVS